MARHNREGRGTDQAGHEYTISYQPDWLKIVKVTRDLESGRQSTKTLFQNPNTRRRQVPGDKIRTRITCPDQGIDLEIVVNDPNRSVENVRVCYHFGEDREHRAHRRTGRWDRVGTESIEFSLEGSGSGD